MYTQRYETLISFFSFFFFFCLRCFSFILFLFVFFFFFLHFIFSPRQAFFFFFLWFSLSFFLPSLSFAPRHLISFVIYRKIELILILNTGINRKLSFSSVLYNHLSSHLNVLFYTTNHHAIESELAIAIETRDRMFYCYFPKYSIFS